MTRSKAQLKEFWQKHGDIIMKPLDGMGGASIFRVKGGDPNIGVIAETLTEPRSRYSAWRRTIFRRSKTATNAFWWWMANRCLTAWRASRRVAKPVATWRPVAAAKPRPLTESDWEIARRVGPTLKAKGLIFVGLDIIGDRLTEVNVTSPTCIREIEAEFPISITGMLMDAIEKRLQK